MRPTITREGASRSPRFRVPIIIGVVLIFTVFLSASGIAQLYTDWLWFDNIGFASVWRTLISTQVVLALMFTLTFFGLLWVNLYLADRMAPPLRLEGPEDDLIERYHQMVGPHAGKLRIAIAAFFAGFAGLQTGRQWETWILFRNGGDFGFVDPLFNRDAGFYVFRLPFWTFLIDWFFAALVFTLILTTIAHYMNGGIRAASPTNRVSPNVKTHLSILLAVLAALRAAAYWFDRFELVTGTRGAFTGALATDVEIQLPALNLLTMVSLFLGGLILYNIRRKGFGLPIAAVGIWMVVHIVAGSIFPSLYQRLRVEPQLSSQEAPFIARNIEATRFAFGLNDDTLVREAFDYEDSITSEALAGSEEIFERVQLLDPSLVDNTLAKDEATRKEYDLSEPLDIDRYVIDGEQQPVVLSARSLDLAEADQGWENQHLAYTHGYGAAIALAAQTSGSAPVYLMQGVGPALRIDDSLDVTLEIPQLYFSDGLGGFAVVGARRNEIDYFGSSGQDAQSRYDGEGGVPMGSLIQRVAFSLRFQDLSTLISGEMTSDSEIIFNRDVVSRARTVAPFLEFDSDPYPVIADGRIQWIVDAYTTTNRFPYAQANRVSSLPGGADLGSRGINYIRNSVKAVIDGYDGDVRLYVTDPDDPLVDAYAAAFPDLFTPVDEASQTIRDHFRYAPDLFSVQSEMFATYHVSDPVQFLQGNNSWEVANEPLQVQGTATNASRSMMSPQYRLTELPGREGIEWVVQRPYVPSSGANSNSQRPELTAVLVGRSDGENAGQLVLYELPTNTVSAPDIVDTNIRQDQIVFDFTKPLDNTESGATANWGEMQLVMVDNTIVYVRPLFVAGDDSNQVPRLTQIIAVNGDRVGMAPTLDEALAKIVSGAPPSEPVEPIDPDDLATDGGDEPAVSDVPDVPSDLDGLSAAQLLGLAGELLDSADSLQSEDPERAAELRAQAQQALDRLSQILGIQPAVVPRESGEA